MCQIFGVVSEAGALETTENSFFLLVLTVPPLGHQPDNVAPVEVDVTFPATTSASGQIASTDEMHPWISQLVQVLPR